MKEGSDGVAVNGAYGSQSNIRCGNCWAEAYTHVHGAPVCETHAKAYGVVE
jgi:hypothetical protein